MTAIKTGKTLGEIEAEALQMIRDHNGCKGVRGVTAYAIDDESSEFDFGINNVVLGDADGNVATRAMFNAQSSLRHRYFMNYSD